MFVHVQIVVPEGRNSSLCIATWLQVAGRYLAVLTLLALHVDTGHVRPALGSQRVLWTCGLTTLRGLILL